MAQVQKKKRSAKKIWLLVLSIVIVATAGFVYYKHAQHNKAVAQERADYAAAESNLDSLAGRIITVSGAADDQHKIRSCGHTSQEYGVGVLYCNVGAAISYEVNNVDGARDLTAKIEQSLMNEYRFNNIAPDPQANLVNPQVDIDLATSDYRIDSLSCFQSYTYKTYSGSDMQLSDRKVLSIELNCSARYPKAQYFPLETR